MTLRADVRLHRGDLELVAHLEADSSGIVAILGPNGSGKTTLLRALAGLLAVEAGRIELDGEVLENTATGTWIAPEHRRVGMVFQSLLLFPQLSALDNVAFGLRSRGVSAAQARTQAYEWLERLEMSAFAASRPRTLSGGQAQRVALARALITEPRLLLLDEPLAAVDASARVELRRTLRTQLAGQQRIRLLVTHDPVEAAALAERVVILEAGHIVQQGSFREVTERPRSDWAARMAGLNLLRGDAAHGCLRLTGGGELTVLGEVSGPALATIHPRAIALHRQQPSGSPRNVVRAVVAGIDHEGDRWRVRLQGRIPLVAEITPAAAAELKLAEGGDVFAAIKATEVDVYPA
ncbi:MAG TPA: ATP-binding cassette domain-containing protein [Candidatus Dormibacteraeota bacterium]